MNIATKGNADYTGKMTQHKVTVSDKTDTGSVMDTQRATSKYSPYTQILNPVPNEDTKEKC